MTKHPVHLKQDNGDLSPTALIPFCEFGGNLSVMGVKIDKNDFPVCNSFEAKIFNDQLCYTVDPNKYRNVIDKGNSGKEDELSLALFINYNEDREVSFTDDLDNSQKSEKFLYVGTLGSRLIQC